MRIANLILLMIILNSCTRNSGESDISITDFGYISGDPVVLEFQYEIGPDHDLIAGNYADARVLSDGRIAILDTRNTSFHILNKDGSLYQSTSLKGRGPGEVENLSSSFAVDNGEHMIFHDYFMRKLSFYSYSDEKLNHIRDLQLGSELSFGDYFYHSPNQLVLHRSTSILQDESFESVSLLTINDNLSEETIIDIPKHQGLTAVASRGTLNLTMSYSSKYHTKNHICINGNQLFYNRSDSVGFSIYNLNSGTRIANYKMDVPAIPLSTDEKESEVDEFIGDIQDLFSSIDRDKLIADMPEFKPLVNKVLCDLPNGIWMALLNEQNESTWALFSDTGRIKGILDHRNDESIISIDQGHIFSTKTSDFGDVTLRVYQYRSVHN